MTVLSKSFSSSPRRALVLGGVLLAATAVLLSVLLRRDDDPRPPLGGNFSVCAQLKGEQARSCYSREVSRELASVVAFLQTHKIGTLGAYQDPKMGLSGELGAEVLPTSIFYDAQGREVWRYVGDLDWTGQEAAKLLAEAGAGSAR